MKTHPHPHTLRPSPIQRVLETGFSQDFAFTLTLTLTLTLIVCASSFIDSAFVLRKLNHTGFRYVFQRKPLEKFLNQKVPKLKSLFGHLKGRIFFAVYKCENVLGIDLGNRNCGKW